MPKKKTKNKTTKDDNKKKSKKQVRKFTYYTENGKVVVKAETRDEAVDKFLKKQKKQG